MFLTVLSSAVEALSFVGKATGFGEEFRLLSLLLLPVTLVVGVGTFVRVSDANDEDVGLVIGMNRLRRAYLRITPDLEPYFVTGSYDDRTGIILTYAADVRIQPSRALSGTPVLVGLINAVVGGVLAGMVCQEAGWSDAVGLEAGIAVTLATGALLAILPIRAISRYRGEHQPRFPTPPETGLGTPGPSSSR